MLVKAASSGDIFGGYTESTWTWNSSLNHKIDNKAFVFKWLHDQVPLKANIAVGEQSQAIIASDLYSSVFGHLFGPDLFIGEDSNL